MQANVLIQTTGLSHDEWLKYRNKGIGGSDAGAICGLNSYKSPMSVYLDKIGKGIELEDNEAMRQGRDFEEYVAKRFEEETGKKVRRRNAVLQHTDYHFMLANIDRWVVGENAGLEIKTTSIMSAPKYKDNGIPEHYELQCHHYMAVTGADKWYLAVLILNKELLIREIPRDEGIIKNLIDIECNFWNNHVLSKKMPAPDGSTDADNIIKEMYEDANSGQIITLYGRDNEDSIKRYKEVDTLIKQLEKEKAQIKQEIQLQMGQAEKAFISDTEIRWANVITNRFDTKSFKKDKPDLYKKYVNESKSRRFEIK